MRLWRKLVVALTGFVLLLSGAHVSADTANTILYVDRNHSAASDSNAGTSASAPLRTISRALEIAIKNKNKNVSTRVLIAPGTYRESVWLWGNKNDASVTLEAQQPGTVIWSGAEDWSNGWQRDGSAWVHNWEYNWGLQNNPWEKWGDWATMPEVIRHREMFIINGTPLRQVLSRNEMGAGTFFVNEGANKVYIQPPAGVNMQNATVKAAVLPYLLQAYNMKNFTISGISFQEAASYASETSVHLFMSENVTITDSRFVYNNWGGLQTWDVHNLTLRNIEASYNGVAGFAINQVRNLVVENVDSSYNNWRGQWGDWHGWADGSKFNGVHGGYFNNYHAVGNNAFGMWLDYDNVDVVVENSYFENNLTGGLYIEASQGPVTVRNSVFINNGDADHNDNGGLFSSGSNDVTFQCNYLRGNTSNQFRVREGRSDVWDWETGANIPLTLSGWKISQNVVIGEHNGQYLIQFPQTSYGGVSGTQMSENVWWHETRSDAFRFVWRPGITFEEFRQYVSDVNSVYAPPEALDDFASNCANPFIQAMMTTPEPTLTATYTPSPTNTMTYTPSPTNTMTYTPSPTNTMTYTPSPTNTMTYTPSPTNTMTYTPSPTNTMTYTPSPTNTPTFTPSPTEDTLVDIPASSQGTSACAASRVVNYAPGLRKNNSLVPLSVANPVKALGMAQNDDTANYVALGFGGALILEFTPNVVVNLPGDDIRVVETTPGDQANIWENYPEQAMIYASQDGEDWQFLGMNRKDMTFDLGMMDWARYVKLVDASNPDLFEDENSDAFDVDAVEMTFCGTDMVDNPSSTNTPVPPPDNSSTTGGGNNGDDPIVTNPEPTADSGDGGLISNPAGAVALELLPICPRGQFTVNNGNNFAVTYSWDIPNTTISGSGTVQANAERYINTDDVNATIRLFVNGDQVAVASSVANCPPEAINDSATTALDTPITIPVLVNDSDSDGDALTINALSQPASGAVSANANGTVTFVPAAGFTGQTTFQYQITDGISQLDAVAVVTVTVGDSDSGSAVCDDPNPARDLKHNQSYLYGDNKDSGQVTNLSNACSYNVGIASYKMVDNTTDNQEIFNFMTRTIGPGETVQMHVSLPGCAAQVDLFYGPVLMSLYHQRYGDRLIEGAYLKWGEWCDPTSDGGQTASAADAPANSSPAGPQPETTAEPTAMPTETSVPAEDATTAADAETPVEEPVVDDPAPVEEPVVEEPTPSPTPQPVVEEPTTVPPTAVPPTTVPTAVPTAVPPTAVPPTTVPTAVPTTPPEPTAVMETKNDSEPPPDPPQPVEPTVQPTTVADSGG